MRRDRSVEKLKRADHTTARPLPRWWRGAAWREQPMPWWREVLDALACAVNRMRGGQPVTLPPDPRPRPADVLPMRRAR